MSAISSLLRTRMLEMIAVTGSPSRSTRWIKLRRSHFEVFFDSVEMMIS
jgi:hypothetical protein